MVFQEMGDIGRGRLGAMPTAVTGPPYSYSRTYRRSGSTENLATPAKWSACLGQAAITVHLKTDVIICSEITKVH